MLLHEREQFLVVSFYLLVTKTTAVLVIYSIKFIVFTFLVFTVSCRGCMVFYSHRRENQLVLCPAKIMIHVTGHKTKRNYNSTKKEVFHKGFLQQM